MKKRTYQTVEVHGLVLERLLVELAARVIVAIDIAKQAMVAGLADAAGKTVALVRFKHPTQTLAFVEMLCALRDRGRAIEVAMEPTGSYGDSLRHQVESRGFPVFRIDPKRCHDFAAVLDGVPSQHDPKSCTLIAYLHSQGISSPWRSRSAVESRARALADQHIVFFEPLQAAQGRLEALTSAHWPELNEIILQRASWHLHLLAEYPSPQLVAARPEEVRAFLRRAACGNLSEEKVQLVIDSSSRTLGAPIDDAKSEMLQAIAQQAVAMRARVRDVEQRQRDLCDTDATLSRLSTVVGPAAAIAIYADLGDPTTYDSAAALEKACGLNLRETSSGRHQGKLRITKRGPARVRKYLYLAAMRAVAESGTVRAWYERRAAHRGGLKRKALVAVMRKQLRALFHVARGASFDESKLFDLRRLSTPSEEVTTRS